MCSGQVTHSWSHVLALQCFTVSKSSVCDQRKAAVTPDSVLARSLPRTPSYLFPFHLSQTNKRVTMAASSLMARSGSRRRRSIFAARPSSGGGGGGAGGGSGSGRSPSPMRGTPSPSSLARRLSLRRASTVGRSCGASLLGGRSSSASPRARAGSDGGGENSTDALDAVLTGSGGAGDTPLGRAVNGLRAALRATTSGPRLWYHLRLVQHAMKM